jgi:hypothetical protein
MNKSTHKKISEGSAEINKVMPHAHGEEWRGRNNHHKKAK